MSEHRGNEAATKVSEAFIQIMDEMKKRGHKIKMSEIGISKSFDVDGQPSGLTVHYYRKMASIFPTFSVEVRGFYRSRGHRSNSFPCQTYKPGRDGLLPISRICDRIERRIKEEAAYEAEKDAKFKRQEDRDAELEALKKETGLDYTLSGWEINYTLKFCNVSAEQVRKIAKAIRHVAPEVLS